jgi:hypothetical protein
VQDLHQYAEPDFEEFTDIVTEGKIGVPYHPKKLLTSISELDVWGQQRLQKRHTDSAGNFEEDFDQDFDDESKDKLSQRFRVTLQNLLDSLSQDRSAESSLKALLELVGRVSTLEARFYSHQSNQASLMRSTPVVRQMVVAEQYIMPMIDSIRSTTNLAANSELLSFLYEVGILFIIVSCPTFH